MARDPLRFRCANVRCLAACIAAAHRLFGKIGERRGLTDEDCNLAQSRTVPKIKVKFPQLFATVFSAVLALLQYELQIPKDDKIRSCCADGQLGLSCRRQSTRSARQSKAHSIHVLRGVRYL